MQTTLCTTCGTPLQETTAADGSNRKPTAGSYTLCYYCGALYVFAADMGLTPVPPEEEKKLPESFQLVVKRFRRELELIRKLFPPKAGQNLPNV